MRMENSHQSELVSQLLYGECFKIKTEKKEWLQIITLSDNYSGWIDQKQIKFIPKADAELITFKENSYSEKNIDYIENSEKKLSSLSNWK